MKSLIMSASMVRALLDGRKTVTRRVIKEPFLQEGGDAMTVTYDEGHSGLGFYTYYTEYPDEGAEVLKPPVQEGDTIYIRENWLARRDQTIVTGGMQPQPGDIIVYRADNPNDDLMPWRSPMFMPEWASRIKLRITRVSAERLQDITDDDVDAEFLGENYPQDVLPELFPSADFAQYENLSHQDIYARLWDSLNAARGHPWESNPWVWRIQFEVIQ